MADNTKTIFNPSNWDIYAHALGIMVKARSFVTGVDAKVAAELAAAGVFLVKTEKELADELAKVEADLKPAKVPEAPVAKRTRAAKTDAETDATPESETR